MGAGRGCVIARIVPAKGEGRVWGRPASWSEPLSCRGTGARWMVPLGVSSWERERLVAKRKRRFLSVADRTLQVSPVQCRAVDVSRRQCEQYQQSRRLRSPGPRVAKDPAWCLLKWLIAEVGVKRGPVVQGGKMHLSKVGGMGSCCLGALGFLGSWL